MAAILFTHFLLKPNVFEYYKYIGMRITGPSWDGRYMILLNAVEFYGQMI